MKIIDLSMTIQPHWRWKVSRELAGDLAKGDPFQISVISMPVHASGLSAPERSIRVRSVDEQ